VSFKEIFDRHFFSNHHVEAKRLEARLEALFPGRECVTFASFPALLTVALDELCDDGARVHVAWDASKIGAINAFFRASGRQEVQAWNEEAQAGVDALRHGAAAGMARHVFGVLMRDGTAAGLLLEMAGESPLLLSAGVLVTQDGVLAEKVRWARSSYGRRSKATIHVAANGRFSEFQASLLNQAFDGARQDG
jgi:hypothetical protein